MSKKERAPLSHAQQTAAYRLLNAWEEKKRKWKEKNPKDRYPSRENVSQELGWSHSMLGQYLRGDAALNLKALIKISNWIGCDPTCIYPELFEDPYLADKDCLPCAGSSEIALDLAKRIIHCSATGTLSDEKIQALESLLFG